MCLGRESNPHGRFGPRDFRTTMAFATIPVCGLDYSFTMGLGPLGVPCLVSAPSSSQRLGSRLPSAFSVKVSLNLRHSTSLFSESALKLCLSPSCLPFHHQGKMWECKDSVFCLKSQTCHSRAFLYPVFRWLWPRWETAATTLSIENASRADAAANQRSRWCHSFPTLTTRTPPSSESRSTINIAKRRSRVCGRGAAVAGGPW